MLIYFNTTHPHSCEDAYYFDSNSGTCEGCSTVKGFVPAIVLVSIIVFVLIVALVAYNITFLKSYCADHKEDLLMRMNQGTMLLVMSQLIVSLADAHTFHSGSNYVS